ncbi:glycosyltransferase family A protein [Enterobacter asburiae]|uniref:glycosyltransferase family A protein n=1 Tax=Enterobacter asburiae TaxID=61645 RepID=UPI0034CE0D9A
MIQEYPYKCSVITPVYNEERNINAFLNMLSEIYDPQIQFLIIDDGSTDKTFEIISNDSFIRNNNNIRIINKKNGGAAEARFVGINNSESNFIVFCDCDDKLDQFSIKKTLAEFEKNEEIDLALFDYYACSAHEEPTRFNYTIKNWPISGYTAFENTISLWGIHAFGIYRKETILAGYNAIKNIVGGSDNNVNDDELIARMAMLNARKITLSEGKYYYSENTLSTTRRVNSNLFKMAFTAQRLAEFITYMPSLSLLIPAVHLYMMRVATNLTIKRFLWRKKINNKSEWDLAVSSLIQKVKFKNIIEITKHNKKLLTWSLFKFMVLKAIYGFRNVKP